MKPGKITHTLTALLSSVTSLFAHEAVTKAEPTKVKLSKKSEEKSEESRVRVESLAFTPSHLRSARPSPGEPYPWKRQIVTTVFWIGEKPSENNPVPNRSSSWDKEWSKSYGGFDDPNPARRQDYTPVKFTPRQNPFYCALPYNDKAASGHRPEAAHVVPWFNDAYQGPGRASEAELEQRRRSRCFSGGARLSWFKRNRRDRLAICRLQERAARAMVEVGREQHFRHHCSERRNTVDSSKEQRRS